MFWIDSETPTLILQGFTNIAIKLGMLGAKPENHEENKRQVLYWLRSTTLPWLIVFDNVETRESLTDYWPESVCGSILIIARDSSASRSLVNKSCQIPALSALLEVICFMALVGILDTMFDNLSATKLHLELGFCSLPDK